MRSLWHAAVVAWLAVVTSGFAALWRYSAGRGTDSLAPVSWPEPSRLTRAADRATLLMFVHPHCACSRASLIELRKLVARVPGRLRPVVVFARAEGAAGGSELRELAGAVPGVTLVDDDGAAEARRFGAATSGATLLYDSGGRLLFVGGLTQVRGHEGNSFGQERIVALVTTGEADRRDSPVFGCAIGTPSGLPASSEEENRP